MKKTIKIAFLMTCYNRINSTLKCLNCLYNIEIPKNINFDIYLVDDKSPDFTGRIIKEKYPEINVINGSGSLFWNRGMHLAWKKASNNYNYDFYIWLNDDTFLKENALREILSDYFSLYNNNIEAIIAGTCKDTDSDYISYGGLDSEYRRIIPNGKPQFCKYINGNFTLISKNIFLKNHNLSYRFIHSAGDHDYGLRAIKHGYKCYISSNILAYCKDNNDSKKFSDWKNPEKSLKKRFYSVFSVRENNTRDYFFLVYQDKGLLPAIKMLRTSLKNVFFPKNRTDIVYSEFNTPILFLIFNRINTTKLVFEQIKKIRPSKLYLASDGPRINKEGETELVNEIRQFVLDSINWNCEIKTLFRTQNLGCGKAVSNSITWFFENEESGIILEDDCLPSLSFFSYCQILLKKYKDNNNIFHIAGHNPLTYTKSPYSYYFAKIHHCWGWASWRRAWEKYCYNIDNFYEYKKKINKIFKRHIDRIFWNTIFQKMVHHEIDTWDYQWVYYILINDGLCINPTQNLVTNIGFGDEATHTIRDDLFHNNQLKYELTEVIHPNKIKTNRKILKSINNIIIGNKISLFKYFKRKIIYLLKLIKKLLKVIISILYRILRKAKLIIKTYKIYK